MAAIGLLVALAATAAAPAPPGWERIFSATDPRASLSSIAVQDDGSWVAGGGDLIVRGGKGPAEAHSEPGLFIVGVVGGGGTDPVLAVGADDLILRWDGHAWVRDSFAPDAPKLGRSQRRRLLLQGGVHLGEQPLIVYGPWRVFTRQGDGTWKASVEADRYRLMSLAQMGPEAPHPKGCDRLQWRWLARGDGWLGCRDGRSFLVGADGASTERGRLPASCVDALGSMVRRGNTLVAACDKGSLWRSEDVRWERMAAPKVEALAADARCLYGVAGGAVWRNCSP